MNALRVALDPLLTWRPCKKDLAEVLLIASALPLYYLVRGQAHQRVEEAVQRGVGVVNLEKSLGIFWEVELQSWVLPYDWLLTFLNGFYLYGHLPIIGVLAVWMYFWHRPQYLVMRNAFLISGAIGLVIFVNFPTAPPRLLELNGVDFGFVDTILQEYKTSRPDTPSFFVNEYAALPSLHIGWNLLASIALWMSTRNVLMRAFAVLMPLTMFAVIVLTANHYIVDAFAGFAVMMVGLAIALAARWFAVRRFPSEKTMREKGWVAWLHWLCGVPDEPKEDAKQTEQPA
jgi:TctA family transporter